MPLGDGIMHRAKPVAEKFSDDYFVIVKRCWASIEHARECVGRGKSGIDQSHSASNMTVINLLRRKMQGLLGKRH